MNYKVCKLITFPVFLAVILHNNTTTGKTTCSLLKQTRLIGTLQAKSDTTVVRLQGVNSPASFTPYEVSELTVITYGLRLIPRHHVHAFEF